MALVQCTECGGQVSDKAAACPSCGAPPVVAASPPPVPAPPEPEDQTPPWKVLVGVLVFAGLVWGGVHLLSQDRNAGRSAASKPPAPAQRASAPAPAVEAPDAILRRLRQAEGEGRAAEALSLARGLLAAYPDSPEAAMVSEQMEQLAQAEGMERARALWSYDRSEDAMTGRPTSIARIRASNPFALGWPYQGEQRASLSLRIHPAHGRDVIFSIEKGQLICPIRDCTVSVRFDDAQPVRFRAAGPADHSRTILFLSPFDRFYQALRRAKRVRIEPIIYEAGGIVMEFDVSGFEPEQFDPR